MVIWLSFAGVLFVFWVALFLLVFVAEESSAKDIGVALLTGLVLAAAAFALNGLLDRAIDDRDLARREAEAKLAINRGQQSSFRAEDMRGFDLSGIAFVRADGGVFDLSFADLTGAKLVDAELRGAQLRRTTLAHADLTGVDVAEASLRGADLRGAMLRGANLTNADLAGADMRGADLAGAIGFVQQQDGDPVRLDDNTRCPGDARPAELDERQPESPMAVQEEEDGPFVCDQGWTQLGPEAHQQFFVSTHEAFGTVVGQVLASDPDGNALTYEITDGHELCQSVPEGFAKHFHVDRAKGLVTVAEQLDRSLWDKPEQPRAGTICVRVSNGDFARDVPIHIALNDHQLEIDTALVYVVPMDSRIGAPIGKLLAPLGWMSVSFEIVGTPTAPFKIDRESGVLEVDGALEAGETYILNIQIESDVPPARSATIPVRVMVTREPTVATEQSGGTTDLYLVERGGSLDFGRGNNSLLTPEQIEAGERIELLVSPTSGSIEGEDVSSGDFVYRHGRNAQPDFFSYRTSDQPDVEHGLNIAVVEKNGQRLLSTSAIGATVLRVRVVGVPIDSIDVQLTAGRGQSFSLQSDGTIVTAVTGEELLDVSPWHELEITITDIVSGRFVTLTADVEIEYVVPANGSLSLIASEVLNGLAKQGSPCAESASEYLAEIVEINELQDETAIEPGDVLRLPDCRPNVRS